MGEGMKLWFIALAKTLGVILGGAAMAGMFIGTATLIDFYVMGWLGMPTRQGYGYVVLMFLLIFVAIVGAVHEDEKGKRR